jgi:hypothetical protein
MRRISLPHFSSFLYCSSVTSTSNGSLVSSAPGEARFLPVFVLEDMLAFTGTARFFFWQFLFDLNKFLCGEVLRKIGGREEATRERESKKEKKKGCWERTRQTKYSIILQLFFEFSHAKHVNDRHQKSYLSNRSARNQLTLNPTFSGRKFISTWYEGNNTFEETGVEAFSIRLGKIRGVIHLSL